jgi:hypothetical protein
MSALSDADPQTIQNLVKDLQSRVAALEQASVHFNAIDEAAPDVGGLQYIATDPTTGITRVIISPYDIFDTYGIHAFIATFDPSGNPNLTVDANSGLVSIINGALTISGASGYLAIGTTPPTGPSAGTGIWEDYTGIYALTSGVQNATLTQNGLSFANGAGVLNGQGMTLTGDLFTINFNTTDNSVIANVWMGMTHTDPNGPDFRIYYQQPPPGTELVTNGGGETGDTTGWAAVSGSVGNAHYGVPQSINPYAGTYYLYASQTYSVNGSTPMTAEAHSASRFAVTAGSPFTIQCAIAAAIANNPNDYNYEWSGSAKIRIRYYNASSGGTNVGNKDVNVLAPFDLKKGGASWTGWQYQTITDYAPAGSTYAEIDAIGSGTLKSGGWADTGYLYFDVVSVKQAGAYAAIQMSHDGLIDFSAPIRMPSNTTPGTPAAGYLTHYVDANGFMRAVDSNGSMSHLNVYGYMPFALALGLSNSSDTGNTTTCAANGGSCAVPVLLNAPMLLYSVSVLQASTSGARTWGWDLYEGTTDSSVNGARIATCSANDSFTASAVSVRTITALNGPIYLAPGLYWVVVQSRHATQTFVLSSPSTHPMNLTLSRTKTTTNPNGATLDLVTGWAANQNSAHVRLNGVIPGESSPL